MTRTLLFLLSLLVAQMGITVLAPSSGPGSIFSSEARAERWPKKVANLTFAERNASSSRVVVVIKDDNDNEAEVGYRVVVVVKDEDTNEVLRTAAITTVNRVVQRYAWEDVLFEESAVGQAFTASLALWAGDQVVGVADLDLAVADLLAYDEDLGDAQDKGWLTDAGDVQLTGGAVVNLHAGIRDQGDGTQKVVVKVRGDEDLGAQGITDIELQLYEASEGPVPLVNPLTVLRTGSTTRLKDKVDNLFVEGRSDQLLELEVYDGGALVLAQPPMLVSTDADGRWNATVAPDPSAAIRPASAEDLFLATDSLSGQLDRVQDSLAWLDAVQEESPDYVPPGGSLDTVAPTLDQRSGQRIVRFDGMDTNQVITEDVVLVDSYQVSEADLDELVVGHAVCDSPPGDYSADPVGEDGTVTLTFHRREDGYSKLVAQKRASKAAAHSQVPGYAPTGTWTTVDEVGNWTRKMVLEVSMPDGEANERYSVCSYGCYSSTSAYWRATDGTYGCTLSGGLR